jgi:putative FmdB family regulatory protein
MPIYLWECKKCQQQEEVVNCLQDSDRGPEHGCKCGADDWNKVLTAPGNRWRYVDQAPNKKG